MRGFTPPVGQRLWLLGVDVWVNPESAAPAEYMSLLILSGLGEPALPGEILTWQNILPCHWPDGSVATWSLYHGRDHLSWKMNQYFEGEQRRFGFWASTSDPATYQEVRVSFQISEG